MAAVLLAGGLFILALGQNPFEIYGTIVSGAFRSAMAIQATIKYHDPAADLRRSA